jgi:hypothetical protein
MSTTREFDELALDGSNYPTWASDIKIALAARKNFLNYTRTSTRGYCN